MHNITIIDVAKAANVSTATVSRVISGNYPVKEATKQAVLLAIEKLGYVPNLQARELNLRRSTTIGVIVPDLFNMFFAQVFASINQSISQLGYSTLIACSNDNAVQERQNMEMLLARNVCGIINVSPNTYGTAASFYDGIARKLPLVFINGYTQRPGISCVNSDEVGGAKAALQLLLQKGHRQIAFLRGKSSDSYELKEEIYKQLMEENKLPTYIVRISGGNSQQTSDHTAKRVVHLLKTQPQLTAIFSCNDIMAVAVLETARLLGRSVPHDLAVTGFDNIILSRYVTPQLTTVDQQMRQLGKKAVELLLQKMADKNKTSCMAILPTQLLIRESV